MGNSKRMVQTSQPLPNDPDGAISSKMQKKMQQGFQCVNQLQVPHYQQPQASIPPLNSYQYMIPHNYSDLGFQQQQHQQPHNPRAQIYQKVCLVLDRDLCLTKITLT